MCQGREEITTSFIELGNDKEKMDLRFVLGCVSAIILLSFNGGLLYK